MESTDCLLAITIFYLFILFLDRFFKSCAMYPYIVFLNGTGLNIGVLKISWKTSVFNRTFLKFGTKYKNFLNIWFRIGLYTSLILLPIAIILLLIAMTQLFFISSKSSSKQDIIIEPVIPGITSPINEVGYYAIALAISSFFHELGHALAAVREDIHLTDMGYNIFFILPVAFVLISTEQLTSLNAWKRLHVLCAGVWHNLVVAGIAFLLFYSLPILLHPFYILNHGMYITEIKKNSPLLGANGLEVHDTIIGLNEFKVQDETNWVQYLSKMMFEKPGYCVETDFVHALDESVPIRHGANGVIDCCESDKGQNMCFEYITDGVLQLPPHMCLPTRKIVEHAKTLCYSETCPTDLLCVKPVLHNTTSLINIHRSRKKNVIYIGHPADIYHTVKVSRYIPKTYFLNVEFADRIELLLMYLIIFSLGVAIINVLPCWYLDGQYIIIALMQLLSNRIKSKLVRDFITLSITTLGTLFLILVIIGGLLMKLWT